MVQELRRFSPFDREHLPAELVLVGGIGENAPAVRARVCEGLTFLGIELEEHRNAANEGVISSAVSRITVRVTHTDEELMIARSLCSVLELGITSEKETSNSATNDNSRYEADTIHWERGETQ